MMKNRFVAMLLAAVLVLSLVVVPAPVSAADEYTVRLADASGNSVVTAKAGDTVTLSLSIENNPGIISVGVKLAYPQGLTVTKHELPAADMMNMYMVGKFMPNITPSQTMEANPFVVWMNQATGTTENKLVTYNGKFYEVSFKVADNAQAGDYKITLTAPADMNSTANVDGSDKIIPGSILDVTGIVLVDCTIRVESDECAHSWGEWTDKPGEVADCDTPGKQIRECSICHETDEKDVSAKGHSFTTYTETTGATCITNAKETATCDNGCGETDEREVANTATGEHNFQGQPYHSNNDATCTADGTRYRICAVPGCGAKETAVTDPNTKLPHTFDQQNTDKKYEKTPATCGTPAVYYYSCSCGEKGTTTFNYGTAAGHNFTRQEVAEEYKASGATCTAKATYYYSCSCGKKGTQTFEYGNMLEHTYNKEVATETYKASGATCTAKATYYKSCVCGAKGAETFASGEFAPHVYDQEKATAEYEATPASCTVKATYYKSCVCGLKGTETFASGDFAPHTYDKEVATETYKASGATCTAKATYYKSCVCGAKGTETFASGETLPHTYDKEVATDAYKATGATCLVKATYYKSCVCGAKGTETFASGELAAHTFTVWTKVDDKEHKSICDVQGCLQDKKENHSFSDKLTAGENTHWYVCVCGEKKDEAKHTYDDKSWAHDDDTHWQVCACGNKTVAAKHNWDEGKVTVETSTKQEGEKTYTCKDCGATYIQKIPQIESPKNGDSFDVSLCVAVMLLAVLSMALVFVIRKKANRE